VETFIRTSPFRFAENVRINRVSVAHARLLPPRACGMIAATAIAENYNKEQ
jgi:hypothetical protein